MSSKSGQSSSGNNNWSSYDSGSKHRISGPSVPDAVGASYAFDGNKDGSGRQITTKVEYSDYGFSAHVGLKVPI